MARTAEQCLLLDSIALKLAIESVPPEGIVPRSHAFCQLAYHFVWATRNREPLLDAGIERCLYPFLAAKCQELGYVLYAANGTADHVHLVLGLTPSVSVAEAAKALKGAASRYINQKNHASRSLYWQEGYGVLTLRQGEIPRVAKYIQNQKQHHAAGKDVGIWERTE